MRYFEGVECCLESIEDTLLTQLKEDKCICASCYLGYSFLYDIVTNPINKKKYYKTWLYKRILIHKKLQKYWKEL